MRIDYRYSYIDKPYMDIRESLNLRSFPYYDKDTMIKLCEEDMRNKHGSESVFNNIIDVYL